MTRVWPIPDDLLHAAGLGNLDRVKAWFDAAGNPEHWLADAERERGNDKRVGESPPK